VAKDDSTMRAGRVALAGRPNVGKSTLLNALVGQKLAIVAPKPQTTRTHLLGVMLRSDPPTQIAFVDTPGLHRPKNALGRALVESAKGVVGDVDLVVLVADVGKDPEPPKQGDRDDEALATVRAAGKPALLALNKIDRVADKTKLLPVLDGWLARHPFEAVVPISAKTGNGLDRLVAELRARLPEGPLYAEGEEALTDRPERFFAAELVREQLIAQTREEVPHSVAVVIDRYVDESTLARIDATIVVEKASQKKIVVGARGARIKEIGTAARIQIEALVGKKVMLTLWVKVIPEWTDDAVAVRRILTEGG
jgi:GTP-binding protein Era